MGLSMEVEDGAGYVEGDWEDLYRPLPPLFLALFLVWAALAVIWVWNTWSKRRLQSSNLQWTLALIPGLKSLVLGLSFHFWYTCLEMRDCAFWVAFGVFVSRIFFETICFVCFMLIAHGFCITRDQLSRSEGRGIIGLSSLFYLTLTGYKAAVPRFSILVLFVYIAILVVVFMQLSRNLQHLREELLRTELEGVQMMHPAIFTKYTMLRRFQLCMLVMVFVEVLMHSNNEAVADEYWLRLVLRELVELAIFANIGWTFRSRGEVEPFFAVIPTVDAHRRLPPIHSVQMSEKEFNSLDFNRCHIGVLTHSEGVLSMQPPILVIVQNPGESFYGSSPPQSPSKAGASPRPWSPSNSYMRTSNPPKTLKPPSILCPPASISQIASPTEARGRARRSMPSGDTSPPQPPTFKLPPSGFSRSQSTGSDFGGRETIPPLRPPNLPSSSSPNQIGSCSREDGPQPLLSSRTSMNPILYNPNSSTWLGMLSFRRMQAEPGARSSRRDPVGEKKTCL